MKTKYFLTTLLTLFGIVNFRFSTGSTALAQNVNRLYIPDLTAVAGEDRSVAVPFYMENTSEVVAVQFLLEVPEGCTLDVNSAQLTNRKQDHSVTIRKQQNGEYLCLLYSPTNKSLLGRSGELFSVNMYVNSDFAEGSTHEFQLQDVVLSMRDGSNCLTSAETGVLTMQQGPDLYANQVTTDAISYAPGQSATISWQVQNIGGRATEAGWTEYISLKDANGTRTLLATQNYDNILAAGSSVSRQITIQLPKVLAMDGEVQFEVEVRPTSQTGESQGLRRNNTATSANVQLSKLLFLEYPTSPISETYQQPVRLTLTRSGDRTEAETFSIQHAADSRITLPEEVTIGAGQSAIIFYLQLTDNDVLDDGNGDVNITINGNNYPQTTAQLVIEDNEYPDLTITASQTDINEGETFQLTITTSRPSDKDITVRLACENASRFTFPSTATIPANANSVTVDVTAKEDDLPSLELTTAFTANAAAHNKGEVYVILHDDDIPALTLSLTPDKVSEGDGPVCVAATLRRTGKTDNKITVRLSDDTNGGIYYATGTKEIVMEKGTEVVNFNLGPVDNNLVDGDRVATITAAVFISSCSCNATGESAGVVASLLTITDNDGPTLKLTSAASTLKEGSQTTLTVTRNTATDEPLSVAIDCDQAGKLSFPSIVTIAAGATSATFDVVSTTNDTQGDSFTAVFTAQANGFSMGTTWLMVTDQTLPDARITRIEADKTEVVVGEKVTFTIEVNNNGADVLPENTKVTLYAAGSSYHIRTSKALGIGESEALTAIVTMPTTIGTAICYARVNENNDVKELNYTNNSSGSINIQTTAPYTATVSVEKAFYESGEIVSITGQLSGTRISNQEVEVYVINNSSSRHKLTATSDDSGRFTAEYAPYSTLYGHFSVGACYPGESLRTEMAAFDIYGMYVIGSNGDLLVVNEAHTNYLNVQNSGTLSLTQVEVEVVSQPDNCEFSYTLPSTIKGGTTEQLNYTVTASAPTNGNEWQLIKLRISTLEGVTKDVNIPFYAQAPKARLVAEKNLISTTAVKGSYHDYMLEITNTGKGETGPITLGLPEWVTCATGTTIGSLAWNESATIVLRFTPTEDMQLNVPVTGHINIKIAGDMGQGTSVEYNVTPVSEATGTLVVKVADENTYATQEAPYVSNATIILRNPSTNAYITEGKTGTNGTFSTILPEGYYKLEVTEGNHDSYSGIIEIAPETTTEKTVNLSLQGIKVEWDVTETEVEDQYEITTEVTYETNVPIPVVELIIPKKVDADLLQDGESLIFEATLVNHGLIAAKDACLLLPEGFTHLTFEPLVEYTGLTIAPKQSITIPVKVTRVENAGVKAEGGRRKVNNIDNDPCVGQPGTLYFWDCGTDRKWHRYKVALQLGSCKSDDPSTWKTTDDDNSGIEITVIYPLLGGIGFPVATTATSGYYFPITVVRDNVSVTEDKGCEPCQNQFLINLVDCGLQLIPAYRTLKAVIGCATSTIDAAKALVNEEKTILQKTGAVLEAVSSCTAAKGAGSGDKDKDRAKKRAEAMESIIQTLGEIIGKIASQDSNEKTDWESIFYDNIAGMAANLLTLAGFDYDHLEEMFCPLKLMQPCRLDSESDNGVKAWVKKAGSKSIANGGYPAYLTDFRYAVSYGLADMMAWKGMKKEIYGDNLWLDTDEEQVNAFVQNLLSLQDENGCIIEDVYTDVLSMKPNNISENDVLKFIERWNNTILETNEENRIDLEKVFKYYNIIEISEEQVQAKGFNGIDDCIEKEYELAMEKLQQSRNSVCSSITLEIKQTVSMKRQAFRGTLSILNGHETTAMEDIKLNLIVTNENGNIATEHEFDIKPETLEGFGYSGEISLTNGWSLDAKQTGVAEILFTPSKYAAPTEPVKYSFGGELTYIDPFTGLEVTRIITPVTLTVSPTADLVFTYFMQRDVLGDDPLTENKVEPSIPAEFSLLINNIGYGDAKDVRMETESPQITKNEKGLLIDFHLLYGQLNGSEVSPVIGSSVATQFGDINAHSTVFAQWWFESSLLGHFTSYNVNVNPISYTNPDLSLINLEQTSIKELIRSIKVDDGAVTGFMVNEEPDTEDMPDMLYFSDGTTASVKADAIATLTKQNNTEYVLSITPQTAGWNYGIVNDPTLGRAKLIGITRMSDNQEINLRNFWQTDRTLVDGNEWLYENKIHFVDQLAQSEENYLLNFEPRPEVELEVESVEGVPEKGTVVNEAVKELTINFNKSVDNSTFSREDLILICEGKEKDDNIGIQRITDTQYKIDLTECTTLSGYYELTVQTATMADTEGYSGADGFICSWNQKVNPTTLVLSYYEKEVTYEQGLTLAAPTVKESNSIANPIYASGNEKVVTVDKNTGLITVKAVGKTTIDVTLPATMNYDATTETATLTILPPEGETEVTPGSPQMVSITIPDGKTMATYCSPYPLDFSSATMDCRAFIASMVNGDIIEFNEIHEAKGGVGMLLYGIPGTYEFPVKSCTEEPYNLFVGTLVPTYVERETDGRTNLGLKGTTFVPINAGVIKANKAYLSTEIEAGVKELKMAFNLWDGVRQVVVLPAEDDDWYTISGQHITKPTKRGLYIHGGKKVVIK